MILNDEGLLQAQTKRPLLTDVTDLIIIMVVEIDVSAS